MFSSCIQYFVAHFTDKISVYFTHFFAKIPNSSRNFFFQLLPVLILRQSLFSFDQKSTLPPFIFSFFMYLPPHRHYYSNLSIQPVKMHILSHKQINHCPDKKAAIQNSTSKKHPSSHGNPQKEGCWTRYPVVVPITACSYQQSQY